MVIRMNFLSLNGGTLTSWLSYYENAKLRSKVRCVVEKEVANVDTMLLGRGYEVVSLFTDNDLSIIQEMIANSVSKSLIDGLTFDRVLKLSKSELAPILRNKELRMLSAEQIGQLKNTASFKKLCSSHYGCSLAKATHPLFGQIDSPEIYFRIVPPGEGGAKELGHIDWWYDDLYDIKLDQRPKFKVWIAIHTEPGLNGLLLKKVNPNEFQFQTIRTDFGPRPLLVDPPNQDFYEFPEITPGQAIIFESNNVLHLGAPNKGCFNRISLEISIT